MLLFLAGLFLVISLPLAATYRFLISVLWLALSAYEWISNRRAYARYGILRIDAEGSVERRGGDGTWQVHALRPGSVVLARLAWLRLVTADGFRYAELVRGDARESNDWRRFQVIWRHVGAAG
jgi:hypothetical protein